MAQTTLKIDGTPRATKVSKPIKIGDSFDAARLAEDKNIVLNFGVHPALANTIYNAVGADPNNVTIGDGFIQLKRTQLWDVLRNVLAIAYEYTGPQKVASKRGGGHSTVSMFNTAVNMLFSSMRSMAEAMNMSDDQAKAMAFAEARKSVSNNPDLASIVIDDVTLEALWAGVEVEEADDEEDDDDEE